MIVIAPVDCSTCGETVYVTPEDAIEIVDDDQTLDCTMHT